MAQDARIRHRTTTIDRLDLFYREAGRNDAPAVLLLHGYPTSSHMFRHVIGPLSASARVLAPDLPGFGFSSAPTVDRYAYTFENLAATIERFLDAVEVDSFFVYLFDFGAAVGYSLALRHPGRVRGLIVQNGNAHEVGLGPAWASAKAYWADPTEENLAKIPDWRTFEGVREEYLAGMPESARELVPPECWHVDWMQMCRPGNLDAQLALFRDYANHVARFPLIAEFHRRHQPPALLLWGRHDPYFEFEEVLAYGRALPALEMHVFNSSHFLLETHAAECSELMVRFVSATVDSRS